MASRAHRQAALRGTACAARVIADDDAFAVATALSAQTGVDVRAVSWKHSDRIRAEQLDNVRALTIPHGAEQIQVTLSLGLAAIEPGESSSNWLARADAALYRAKRAGRNRLELAARG